MAGKHKIFQIDSFTDKPFSGNPAAVTFASDIDDGQKRLIAREMNLSETAFLAPAEDADYGLRWFTPSSEVKLCGHGTIASLHFLHEQGLLAPGSSVTFSTLSGVLKCGMKEDEYYMQIPEYSMKEYNNHRPELLNALGLKEADTAPYPFILLENGNLYICIRSLEVLKDASPDFKELLKITSQVSELEGVVLFTAETYEETSSAHLRYFVPLHGINEDPVTGSANGPLLPVMIRLGIIENDGSNISVVFEQGDFMNRRGRIRVNYSPLNNRLFIAGKAVTVLKGEITV